MNPRKRSGRRDLIILPLETAQILSEMVDDYSHRPLPAEESDAVARLRDEIVKALGIGPK
jgi:hypothetical protein